MNAEIKKRIEMIRRGEVPEGYKRTKIGIMPITWEIERIGKITKEISQKNKVSNINHVVSVTKHRGIVDSLDYFNNYQVYSKDLSVYKIIQKGEYAFPPIHLNEGSIGRLDHLEKAVLSPMYIVFKLNSSKYNSDIFYSIIKSQKYIELYKSMVQGTVNRRGAISYNDFASIPVINPLLPEQDKIAKILSTWDSAIELKEQFLMEKKKQKKWLMQKLLTGKIRLSEYTDKWKELKLRNICDHVLGGGTPSRTVRHFYKGNIPWITVKDLDGAKYKFNSVEHINAEAIKKSTAKIVPKDNLIISTRMGLGRGFINKVDMAINQDMKGIIISKHLVASEFLYYCFIKLSNKFVKLGSGSTVKGIDLRTLLNMDFLLPPLPEQKAIAEILSMADREIDLHEKQLDELKKQKIALMQLLLTGIVRVNLKAM